MKTSIASFTLILALGVFITGCNFPISGKPTSLPDAVKTAAMQTVNAMTTQMSIVSTPTPGSLVTLPTIAQQPTITLALPNQPTVTARPVASATVSQNTPQPTSVCDKATFLRDVTIPDGVSLPPGSSFTKTWELLNAGDCNWNSLYSIVFGNDGTIMGGPSSKPLLTTGAVNPGQVIQISVDLVAPASTGEAKGVWKIRNPSNVTFASFWVDIKVANEFNFVKNLCSAVWQSEAGTLPCPGKVDDSRGYAIKVDNPLLETGAEENEPAIVMRTQSGDNGQISGKFSGLVIPTNSVLKTVVGCVKDAKDCNVKYTIKYQVSGGTEQTLVEGNETYDGSITTINKDLGALGLAGKQVTFTFSARANGNSRDAVIFWLMPRIEPK